jgi:sec-independent protein translocase protein TatC
MAVAALGAACSSARTETPNAVMTRPTEVTPSPPVPGALPRESRAARESLRLNDLQITFLAFGLAFEVPIATVMLIWSGLVSVKSLKAARAYIFLGAFVIGMFLTPPDVLSQTLLAVPMYLLYESGLVLAGILLPEKTTVEEEVET